MKLKIQAHGLERQQQVGKDDRRIHAQLFGGGDGDFGGQVGLLADLHQRVVLADVAVFLHVAPGLAQKPDRGAIHGPAQAGANETAAVEDRFGGRGRLVRFLHTGLDFNGPGLDPILPLSGALTGYSFHRWFS